VKERARRSGSSQTLPNGPRHRPSTFGTIGLPSISWLMRGSLCLRHARETGANSAAMLSSGRSRSLAAINAAASLSSGTTRKILLRRCETVLSSSTRNVSLKQMASSEALPSRQAA
jgi:hypothetical protein